MSKEAKIRVPDEGVSGLTTSAGVYRTVCNKCDRQFSWTLDPDPDRPSWSASCCGKIFVMRPTSVAIEVEEDEGHEPDNLD